MISDTYKKILETSHDDVTWAKSATTQIDGIVSFIKTYNITEVLDYGAGKQVVAKELLTRCPDVTVHSYDPAVPEISNRPDPASMVCCLDVLEHVEPEYIDEVLDDLSILVQHIGYFVVSTRPAQKILSDGRNAHLIIKPIEWWREQLDKRFKVGEQHDNLFIVFPK